MSSASYMVMCYGCREVFDFSKYDDCPKCSPGSKSLDQYIASAPIGINTTVIQAWVKCEVCDRIFDKDLHSTCPYASKYHTSVNTSVEGSSASESESATSSDSSPEVRRRQYASDSSIDDNAPKAPTSRRSKTTGKPFIVRGQIRTVTEARKSHRGKSH